MGDNCCGSSLQEIVLSAAGPAGSGVVLRRCSRCGDRQYYRGGEQLDPADAFRALAGTFQRQARPVRSGLDRRAVGVTARAAQSAQAASAGAAAERAAARAAARAAQLAEKERLAAAQVAHTAPGTVDVTDLTDLLAGWTVLGAAR
jgi:hypothetical protein